MDRQPSATLRGGLVACPTPAMVWGRAGVLGTVALLTGTVSHAVAGGRLPGAFTMLALLASCVLASAWLLLRRAAAPTLALAVLAGQTWAHGVLSAVAGHTGEPSSATVAAPLALPVTGGGTLLEQYRDASELQTAPGQDWLLHQVDHFVAQGPLMLLAHLGGAVVLGLFLAVGEQALWALLTLAAVRGTERRRRRALAVSTRAARLGVAVRAAALVPVPAQEPAPQVVPRATLSHRGPPFVLAA